MSWKYLSCQLLQHIMACMYLIFFGESSFKDFFFLLFFIVNLYFLITLCYKEESATKIYTQITRKLVYTLPVGNTVVLFFNIKLTSSHGDIDLGTLSLLCWFSGCTVSLVPLSNLLSHQERFPNKIWTAYQLKFFEIFKPFGNHFEIICYFLFPQN